LRHFIAFCNHVKLSRFAARLLHIIFAAMRFFTFILSVIVLGLSVVPCADACAMHEKKCKYEVEKESKQNTPASSDECSPFCSCTCCAGFSVYHFIVSIDTLSLSINNRVSSFLPSETIEVILPVWQPPQLV